MGLEDQTLTTLRSAPGKRLAGSHTPDTVVILQNSRSNNIQPQVEQVEPFVPLPLPGLQDII